LEREEESVPAGVHEPAFEILAVRERDRVDEHVQPAPLLGHLPEHLGDLRVVPDVTGHDEVGTDALGQRPDPALQRLARIGEAQGGTLLVHGLGNAPRNAPLVRDPEDEDALAFEKSCSRHFATPEKGPDRRVSTTVPMTVKRRYRDRARRRKRTGRRGPIRAERPLPPEGLPPVEASVSYRP